MLEYYFSVSLDNNRTLCLAPLTDRKIEMSGLQLEDSSGYFLYENHHSNDFSGIEVLAHIMSEDAVMKIKSIFKME